MKDFDGTDYETPIEEYPGLLGYTWDGELAVIDAALSPLESFDFAAYSEAVEGKDDHTFSFELVGCSNPITFEPYADIAFLLEQIDSIEVFFDSGPPDSGPASGAGYLFFLKDGYSGEAVAEDVNALMTALGFDMTSRT